MKRDQVLPLCGISLYQYYASRRAVEKRGRKVSTTTLQIVSDEEFVEVANELVVDRILDIKSIPETDYGYKAMTAALMLLGFVINHKKVYRLMKEYMLLNEPRKRNGRNYVKFARVNASRPLEVLEMDIKFQYVVEHSRYAFILTVIDCFTRKTLHWTVAYSIKQQDVKRVWEAIIVDYLQPNNLLKKELTVEVRNDNDSRFAAKAVQKYFKENHLEQVFTHPYTPQENGHIESFHSILGRSLKQREYNTINELQRHLKFFYKTYNEIRLHGSLDHLTPNRFWRLWNKGLIKTYRKKNGKQCHQLIVPHYLLSGNDNLREISSSLEERLKEVNDVIPLQQPSVQRQPSVISS